MKFSKKEYSFEVRDKPKLNGMNSKNCGEIKRNGIIVATIKYEPGFIKENYIAHMNPGDDYIIRIGDNFYKTMNKCSLLTKITLLHELGHILDDKKSPPLTGYDIEFSADLFAAKAYCKLIVIWQLLRYSSLFSNGFLETTDLGLVSLKKQVKIRVVHLMKRMVLWWK